MLGLSLNATAFHIAFGAVQKSDALITSAVVVLVGVEQGIVLAMVLSLLRIVRYSYHPHTAVLVESESGIWRLTPAVPGAVTEPGLVIYRFGAPLFYANSGRFSDEIREGTMEALFSARTLSPRDIRVHAYGIRLGRIRLALHRQAEKGRVHGRVERPGNPDLPES